MQVKLLFDDKTIVNSDQDYLESICGYDKLQDRSIQKNDKLNKLNYVDTNLLMATVTCLNVRLIFDKRQ